MRLPVAPYPTLHVAAFITAFQEPLGDLTSPESLNGLLHLDAVVPLRRSDEVRLAVRDLLRHRGYKPTGRGKPASEYLTKAAESGYLQPINPAVDACNAVSLHSGLPISVVDLGRTQDGLFIDVPPDGTSYVFNATGQEIRLDGLLCLFDGEGPCANPVRDSQRTKTQDGTTHTLSIVWAPDTLRDRLEAATGWYQQLLGECGGTCMPVDLVAANQ